VTMGNRELLSKSGGLWSIENIFVNTIDSLHKMQA